MILKLKGISTIIFDLGGVIVDLSVERTIEEFTKLSGYSADHIKDLYVFHLAFSEFERGSIDASQFRQQIKSAFNAPFLNDVDIDHAWNAMLIGISDRKLHFMQKVKKKHRVLILSNTNSIHVDHVHDVLLPEVIGENSFVSFVNKVYYSREIGTRKPEPYSYQYVLNQNNIQPHETIFLDDNPGNINAAKELGIHTVHVTRPDMIFDVFQAL